MKNKKIKRDIKLFKHDFDIDDVSFKINIVKLKSSKIVLKVQIDKNIDDAYMQMSLIDLDNIINILSTKKDTNYYIMSCDGLKFIFKNDTLQFTVIDCWGYESLCTTMNNDDINNFLKFFEHIKHQIGLFV